MAQEDLKKHILAMSHAQDFTQACLEWHLVNIYLTEEWDNCPCGQDIKEHCEIANRVTGAQTFVGNVCINRFIPLNTATLFAGLKRIRANRVANVNEDLIAHAEARGFLFPKESVFLRQTARKRSLSEKQLAWKEKINRRILEGIVVRHLPPRKPKDD